MKYFSKVSQESLTRYKRNPAVCSIVCNYILLLKISDLKYHCHGNLVNFFPFWIICSHFSVFSLWREISSRWPSYEANGNGDRRELDWKSSNLRFHISRRWPLCIQQISIETVTFRVKIVKKIAAELEKFGKSYCEVAQFFSSWLWQESKGKSLF